jgi:hypothetical protein
MSSIITKICIVCTMIMTVISLYFYTTNKTLNRKVSDSALNQKAMEYGMISYKDQAGKWHSNSIEQNKTIAQLKYAKDSSSMALKTLAKEYNIKVKNITASGVVKTTLKSETTIHYVPTYKDTTYDLSSPPYIIETIRIHNDSLSRKLDISNKQNLVWYTKKQTIDPPKKFFLLRWFQKKQNVTYVDIINDNLLIKTTSQQFQIITK